MEHVSALPAGTRLGEYEIEAVLGAGGFGITYRAVDITLNKVVAVKEYLPRDFATRTNTRTVVPTSSADRTDYEWGLTRFLDEARTLARFDHPHLNRVHRFFEANGTAYLVLEYIEGETLGVVLRQQQRLRQGQVKRLLADVLSGLEEVHAAGYVHRDIKPSNLMVQPDGSAVVLDFGAARQAVGRRSKSITSILTPGYAPIEQYDTKAEDVGPWSDIYALGMVAYRCISGLRDADLPDAVTRTRNTRKGGTDLVPAATLGKGRYDGRLLEAIDWAVQVNEEDRPQSVGEWRTSLPSLDYREPLASSRSPLPAAEPERSPSAFPRWIRVGGIVTLVIALVGGAYWYGRQVEAPIGRPAEMAARPPATASRQAESPTPTTSTLSEPTPSQTAIVSPQVGAFVVETEPARAEVELLGVEEAYRSGMELPVGRYQIEVRADGYEPQRVWVPHEAGGAPPRVVLAAVRQPFTIVAEPDGARVRIMNIPERYAAGMALPAGEYRVEVSTDGYRTVTETVLHGTEPTERRIALVRAGRQPGETFRDCPTCPEMVIVPAGSFMMGSPSSEEGRDDNEGPMHRVTIGQPFAVGVYEVTIGDWDACIRDRGCRDYRPVGEGWPRGRQWPVVSVSWDDAQAYVRWLSGETGKRYRLLSEAEWEYVARAGTRTPFHFGQTINSQQANYDGSYTYGGGRRGESRSGTMAVGSFGPNTFGLYDMHGNVWEWVQDCWNENYQGAPSDGRAWETDDYSHRVLRGGSWNDGPRNLRSANRFRNTADFRYVNYGFRIARSLP